MRIADRCRRKCVAPSANRTKVSEAATKARTQKTKQRKAQNGMTTSHPALIAFWVVEFRPLLPRPGGWFICQKCLHMARPEQPDFRCFCLKCGELNRAA